jgi:hypothetical protein
MRVMTDESSAPPGGDAPMAKPPKPVVTYPRDAVLSAVEVGKALGVSDKTVDRQGWPSFKVGGRRRYIWGQLMDHWAKEAARSQ